MNPTTTQAIGNSNTSYDGTNMGSFNVPNTNALGTINTSGNLNLTPPPTTPNVAGTLTSLVNTQNTLAQNSQNSADTATNSFNSLLQQYLGQGADQTQLNQQYGTAENQKRIRDLMSLQSAQTAQYIQGLNNIELAKNTRQEANAQSTMLNRQHGIDALLTSSQLQAEQGNLEFSQNLIKNALDLKYEPIRAQIEYQKEIVSQLNTKAATEATRAFDLKLKQVEQEQKNQENIYNLGITAGKNNAPASVVAKINSAKTYADAIALATPYMVSPADKLDLAIKGLQYTKLKNENKVGEILSIDDAQKLGVPYGTTKAQAIALQGKTPVTELQLSTFNNAQKLLSKLTENGGRGAPVGISNISFKIPGSPYADYVTLEKTLKNQLTLENLKYLKGPTSDKDIIFITSASSALNRNTSPKQYKETLEAIVQTLSKYSPEYQYTQSATSLIDTTNDPYSNYTSKVLAQ